MLNWIMRALSAINIYKIKVLNVFEKDMWRSFACFFYFNLHDLISYFLTFKQDFNSKEESLNIPCVHLKPLLKNN